MMTKQEYEKSGDELYRRILALGPQILELTDAWQLFKIPGFECRDLEPTMAQADAALALAQQRLRTSNKQS